jgi:hypothetical protein
MPGKNKSNDVAKATRTRSLARGQARKQLRRQTQDEAAARNRVLRLRGELTPWQAAKAAARVRKRGEGRSAGETGGSNISSIEKAAVADPVQVAKPGSRAGIRAAKRQQGRGNGD